MKFIPIDTKYLVLIVCFLLVACHTKDEIPEQTQDFCSKIHLYKNSNLSTELKQFDTLLNKKTGVYVLEDGNSSLITRAWLCENAEKTIDIQYFIFSTDNVGLIACDYLVKAADRGVKIRIIVDDMMVESSIHDILTMDSHKNIEIKIYNAGVNLGKNVLEEAAQFATHFTRSNKRMHNKTFIVDHQVAITGGRNIADEYFDYDHEYNFRDRDILLIGKTSYDMENSFEIFWNSSFSKPVNQLVYEKGIDTNNATRFDRLHQYACNPENFWPQIFQQIQHLPKAFDSIIQSGGLIWEDSVFFVSDLPGKNLSTSKLHGGGITTEKLTELVNSAQHSIDIQSPYLIVTNKGINIFKEAVQRGVKINILTNSLASTDNKEAFAAYQKVRTTLIGIGVNIYEFKPDAAERIKIATGAIQQKLNYKPIFGLHAKSMVIDSIKTVIGTFNLDPRSANLNTECFAFIVNKKIAQGVLEGMNREYQTENSWKISNQFNPDHEVSTWKRVITFTRKILPKGIL